MTLVGQGPKNGFVQPADFETLNVAEVVEEHRELMKQGKSPRFPDNTIQLLILVSKHLDFFITRRRQICYDYINTNPQGLEIKALTYPRGNPMWEFSKTSLGRYWLEKDPQAREWLKTDAAHWWFCTEDGSDYLDTDHGVEWLNSDDAQEFLESNQAYHWARVSSQPAVIPEPHLEADLPKKPWFKSGKVAEKWLKTHCNVDKAPSPLDNRPTRLMLIGRQSLNLPEYFHDVLPVRHSFIKFKGDEKTIAKSMENHPALIPKDLPREFTMPTTDRKGKGKMT
ncbi:hypothetical protein F5Y15DRAFT_415377 [Xylariaceae sp. FL0016]|nr:hypothetical protein F5Y15DRAFT_415377 [Xylariaceae sp. FL0016]